MKTVVIVGNPKPQSRTLDAAVLVARKLTGAEPDTIFDLATFGPALLEFGNADIAAAIGIHQLKRARAFQQQREAIAARLGAGLRDLPVELPPNAPPGETHAWHLYALRLAEASSVGRDALIERLFAAGIGCSVHYIPLHLQPYWRDRYALDARSFPHSQHAYERMLSLPIYPRMSEADVDRVVAAVRSALAAGPG